MSKSRPLTYLVTLLLCACSGVSDIRPEPVRKSEYYLEHGVSAFENSDYISATDFLLKALAHYRSIDDTTGIILSRINLAETSLAAGNFPAASEHIDAAQRLLNQNYLVQYKSRIALLRAKVQWRMNDREAALHSLSTLLPEFDEEQRSTTKPDIALLGATTLRTSIAFAEIETQPDVARLWLKRLSTMLATTPDRTTLHEARLLRFEAAAAQEKGNTREAFKKIEEALSLYRQSASRPAIAATLTEAGTILMQLEEWDTAEDRLERALYIRLWLMDRSESHKLMKKLLALYTTTGNTKKAEAIREQMNSINKNSQP